MTILVTVISQQAIVGVTLKASIWGYPIGISRNCGSMFGIFSELFLLPCLIPSTVVLPYPLIQYPLNKYPLIQHPRFQLSAVYRGPKKNLKIKEMKV
jgi:hypothetical protein